MIGKPWLRVERGGSLPKGFESCKGILQLGCKTLANYQKNADSRVKTLFKCTLDSQQTLYSDSFPHLFISFRLKKRKQSYQTLLILQTSRQVIKKISRLSLFTYPKFGSTWNGLLEHLIGAREKIFIMSFRLSLLGKHNFARLHLLYCRLVKLPTLDLPETVNWAKIRNFACSILNFTRYCK